MRCYYISSRPLFEIFIKSIDAIDVTSVTLRGGIKKNCFFFRRTPKGGGGLAESKISLSEKTEIFLDFFSKGGGIPPIPKGCYHKKWGYWDIFAKKGALTQSIGMLSKKN